jgi:hypothetical protein
MKGVTSIHMLVVDGVPEPRGVHQGKCKRHAVLVEAQNMRCDLHCLLNTVNGRHELLDHRLVLVSLLQEEGLDERRLTETALA